MQPLHLIGDDIDSDPGRCWTVEAHRVLHAEIALYLAKVARFNLLYPAKPE